MVFYTPGNDSDGIITVQQLIDLLEAVPDKSKNVTSMGCDCIGRVDGIEVDSEGVTITRSN